MTPDHTSKPPESKAVASHDQNESGAAKAARTSLKLSKEEIEFLASPTIGAIASKSPRAVKRFINLYRIVRARLSADELNDFLGWPGTPPRFPIAALLAAIETGQPADLAKEFYSALHLLPQSERLDTIWNTKGRDDSKIPKKAAEALRIAESISPQLGLAVEAVHALSGEQATVGAYVALAGLIRRYSFNP